MQSAAIYPMSPVISHYIDSSTNISNILHCSLNTVHCKTMKVLLSQRFRLLRLQIKIFLVETEGYCTMAFDDLFKKTIPIRQ
jgi:hypothetical protein